MLPRGDDPIAKLEQVYLSACANKHENGISISGNYLLYSRCNSPIVYDLEKDHVAFVLTGHSQQVNGSAFVLNPEADCKIQRIISTSYDQTAIIWQLNPTNDENKSLFVLRSPDESVFTTRSAVQFQNKTISVTTTISGSIILWENDVVIWSKRTEYVGIYSKIHIIRVDQQDYIFLFLSGSDNNVHVFQIELKSSEAYHLFNLWAHDDWVKSVDTLNLCSKQSRHQFLVAAASQDSNIRIWNIKLVDGDQEISYNVKKYVSTKLSPKGVNKHRLVATLETNLLGHEAMVSSLCWFNDRCDNVIRLASCSADKKIIVWQSTIQEPRENDSNSIYMQDSITDLWKISSEFGETGETNLPFIGICVPAQDKTHIYAQSLRGAIHHWFLDNQIGWITKSFITGHHDTITDLSWEKQGSYLISCSLDKTCRIHAISSSDNKWHEIARPQVHGHEINCIASLSFGKFASGAEEKTIRTYGATQFFLKNFRQLALGAIPKQTEDELDQHPVHAQLPALGLSIRGADSPYDTDDGNKNVAGQSNVWLGTSELAQQLAKLDHLESLPTEEILIQSTLWWETNKLFGHGNELHALAVDRAGHYLASASRANRCDLANVIVWECSQFRKAATLEHHSLTVTRIQFSPNDKYLLSVSRDRTWCISSRTGKARPAFRKLWGTCKSNAIHERIIWDCCWTDDSEYFITVSRDKKAILWNINQLVSRVHESGEEQNKLSSSSSEPSSHVMIEKFGCSIQAVDLAPPTGDRQQVCGQKEYVFAFGLENGSLELHRLVPAKSQWQRLAEIPLYHHLPIRRLSFKPTTVQTGEPESETLLASGGDDGMVKLSKLTLVCR